MEGYCQQCMSADRQKPKKEFVTYKIMIYCKKHSKEVDMYGKMECFEPNANWQHLCEAKETE